MNSEERDILIDHYIKNKLSEADRQKFEQALQEDTSLREAVSLRQLSNKLIIQNRLLDVKKLSLETQKNNRTKRIYRLLIGGLVLVTVLIGTYFWSSSSQESKQIVPTSSNSISSHNTIPTVKEMDTLAASRAMPETKFTPQKSKEKKENTSVLLPTQAQELIPSTEKRQEEALHATASETVEEVKPSISIPEPKKLPTEVKNSCSNVFLEADVTASGTCADDQNGSIQVSSIKGGVAPYHYEVVSEKNNQVFHQNRLPIGYYLVFIRDKNKCEKRMEHVAVKELPCLEEFKFNPFAGEIWELPAYPSPGFLTIHEKGGEVYFQTKIESGELFKWNGTSSKGEIKHGLYIFTVTYQDETKKQGEIVIIR